MGKGNEQESVEEIPHVGECLQKTIDKIPKLDGIEFETSSRKNANGKEINFDKIIDSENIQHKNFSETSKMDIKIDKNILKEFVPEIEIRKEIKQDKSAEISDRDKTEQVPKIKEIVEEISNDKK